MGKSINFMGLRKAALLVSAVLLIISLLSLTVRGLNLGIDFTGGVLIEVAYQKDQDIENIRALLEADHEKAVVQLIGGSQQDVLVRIPPASEGATNAEVSDALYARLKSADASAELKRVDFVGPQVGEDLRERGGLAALLAIIGYSLNDTIVVFDRQRENFLRLRTDSTEEILNQSINQTLSRTILTSFTTLIVVIVLFLFGGQSISGFSLAMIVGIVIGTYSSISVASNLLIYLGVTKKTLMRPEVGEQEENLP